MTHFLKILICCFGQCLLSISTFAQSDVELIRSARNTSNELLKAQNFEAELDFSTENVLITTGAGTLICGKAALREYVKNAGKANPMFWVRQSEGIDVNTKTLLAWEHGLWKGYNATDQEELKVLVHGKYSAMWTKASGEWKIKSQLFVTLD